MPRQDPVDISTLRSASNCHHFGQLEGLAFARTWGFESPFRTTPNLLNS
jgi:hypothetical protein